MSIMDNEQFIAVNYTADANPKQGSGALGSIFVSSATAATITIYDGNSASGTKIVDTFTPVAATLYSLPFIFKTGLFVDVSGTISYTVFFS